jgi:hypothetical protein
VEECPEAASVRIGVRVCGWKHDELRFEMKRTARLDKMMGTWAERRGEPPVDLRFLFDGARIVSGDTPASVCCSISFSAFS